MSTHYRQRGEGGTKVGLLFRVPALVTIDLESGSVESVAIRDAIRLSISDGAYAEEDGGILRGAEPGEIARAVSIAERSPWPETTLLCG
jgi:hypothetical protein